MYKVIFGHIYDKLEHEKNFCADLELWVSNSENREIDSTKNEVKESKKRIRELNKCLKFLAKKF